MTKKYFILTLLLAVVSQQLWAQKTAEFVNYTYPTSMPRSEFYQLTINGEAVVVCTSDIASFATFESSKAVDVKIEVCRQVQNVKVLPARLGITPKVEGNTISFKLPHAAKVLLEIDDMQQLFIYGNDIEKDKPKAGDKNVKYYKGGQMYDVGQLTLKDNETLYIEGGAVLRGQIRVTSAKNVKIAGHGILDGIYYDYHPIKNRKFVLFENCRQVEIKDFILINPTGWMIMLYASEDIIIRNVKELGRGHGTDGVDIVGSRKVLIENCIFRNGDDCIAVKSVRRKQYNSDDCDWEGVDDVLVTNSSLQTNMGGQVFEIGHELMVGKITNIKFTNCDVLGAHGQSGVFGIHNSDHAVVSNVLYENIRVDHYYNKLIDIRIIESRWSDAESRGQVENVLLKDIDVTVSEYNTGYSISLIGGYDDNHKVKNVTIDNFKLNGQKVTNADQLDLYIKQAENIIIK